jgi:hypothetical protein
MVHNLPTKLPQKSWMKNRFFLASKKLQSHPNATNWHWLSFQVKKCSHNWRHACDDGTFPLPWFLILMFLVSFVFSFINLKEQCLF